MSPFEGAVNGDRLERILVVDDDVALATGIKRALTNQGYIVRALHGGASVLEVTAVFKPDLVILDVMMPVTDGWDVLANLRAAEASRETPVIVLSAADSDASKVKGFALGADDYVTKPFSLQELRCRVAAILHRCHSGADEPGVCKIPVVVGSSRVEFACCKNVYYIKGVHNFSYVHTVDSKFLSRLTLGSLENKHLEGFRRIHRSYIVNMDHVRGCGWVSKSAYRLYLADAAGTEIPVSRALIPDVQKALGLRS